jgi:hypothetical protein
MRSPLRTTIWLPILLAPLALSQGSCAMFAWLAAQFSPPEKVEALYEPPEGKTILVFVDDVLYPVSYPAIKGELTRQLNQQLTTHELAAKTVPYQRLASLIAATPQFNLLAVSQVGQKVGADIVLYVQIDKFSLKEEATKELWKGELQVTVRMVDVTEGRLWPEDRPAGYRVPAVKTPTRTEASPTYADELTKTLAAQMAGEVAKLFRKHEAPPEGAWKED